MATFGRLQLMDKCNLQSVWRASPLFHMEASPLQEKTPRVLPEQNNNFSTEVHVSIPQYGSTLRIAQP